MLKAVVSEKHRNLLKVAISGLSLLLCMLAALCFLVGWHTGFVYTHFLARAHMSEETLAKLYSPLVTTKAQGMGFGLAICNRMVEAHQGTISVQSVEGKGSTFTLTIPIEPKLKTGDEKTWVIPQESLLSMTTRT